MAMDGKNGMPSVRGKMSEVTQAQPDDETPEETMQELVLDRMIGRGLEDSARAK